jgi:hypothetical protein
LQVAILTPGRLIAFVEAAYGFENAAQNEAVCRDELRPFESGGISLIVRRPLRERDDDPAGDRVDAAFDRGGPLGQPAAVGHAVVVRKGDHEAL